MSVDPTRRRSSPTRMRRRLSAPVVIVATLGVLGALYAMFAPSSNAAMDTSSAFAVKAGRELYLTGCSSCHGLGAAGTAGAPSLIGAGAAAVDFQLSTGRMPLANYGQEAPRKSPIYTETQIREIAAYIASLAPGPPIPTVNPNSGSLALGGQLFDLNCAACHNLVGRGGALSYGKYAPDLQPASPIQIAEAIRTGPESMPVFGPNQLSQHDVNSIVRYVEFLDNPADPGGNGLGHLGPVPEGLVVWVAGIGVLVGITLWIGARA